MEELLLSLEDRLRMLLDRHSRLNITNQSLSDGTRRLVREKDILAAKQERAIEQIRLLLNRLKASENIS